MTLGELKKAVDEALRIVTEETPVYLGNGPVPGTYPATITELIQKNGRTIFKIEVED